MNMNDAFVGSLIFNRNGGGGGGAQVALTQAEYDALVQAGTVDPTMEYFITDGIPSSVKYYHNYSTDEQIVGTWIDGKPLYEVTKSFQYDTSWGGTRAQIAHGISNIDTPVDINCRFYNRSSGALFKEVIRADNDNYALDLAYYQSSLELNAQAFTSSDFIVAFGNSYYYNSLYIDLVVTFRYTKSSS